MKFKHHYKTLDLTDKEFLHIAMTSLGATKLKNRVETLSMEIKLYKKLGCDFYHKYSQLKQTKESNSCLLLLTELPTGIITKILFLLYGLPKMVLE